MGNLDEAIDSFQQALRLRPNFTDARNNLRRAVQQALRLEPDSFAAQNNFGNILAKQEIWDDAIACYHKALQLKPDYATPYGNLGNVWLNQGQIGRSPGLLSKGFATRPGFCRCAQ